MREEDEGEDDRWKSMLLEERKELERKDDERLMWVLFVDLGQRANVSSTLVFFSDIFSL